MKRILKVSVVYCFVFVLFNLSVSGVEAGFSPSDTISTPTYNRTEDLQKIQKALELKMVKERLVDLGFTEDEIQKRLDYLSDGQIHNLAQNMEQLRVGGGIVGLLIVIPLIIIILAVALLI